MTKLERLCRLGDSGVDVAEVRTRLRALGLLQAGIDSERDALFDEDCDRAVRSFQQTRGLMTDGIVGQQTWRALRGSRFTLGVRPLRFQPSAMLYGDDVSVLQERLLELGYDAGRADGIFGASTDGALRSFQRDYGLRSDGVCGPETLRGLHQLGRRVTGGRPQMLREAETLHRRGTSLRGKRIMIDPGHGDGHTGAAVDGIRESDIVWDLANRVSDLLADTGAQPLISRSEQDDPDDYERAERCNAAAAELVVSLHVDASTSRLASGVAGFHYGTGSGSSSTVGERLAGLIAREVSQRVGMTYLSSHAKTWDLLRLTAMPAVRIEVGYLTNDDDRALLADPGRRQLIAEAIVIGIQRLYLPPERDRATGALHLAELRRSL